MYHLQFNLGNPECSTKGHWGTNDEGKPWFIYDDINESPAQPAYVASLSKDVSMPTIAFEDWFIKHKDQIYDDGLWDQMRKYHKTDRVNWNILLYLVNGMHIWKHLWRFMESGKLIGFNI